MRMLREIIFYNYSFDRFVQFKINFKNKQTGISRKTINAYIYVFSFVPGIWKIREAFEIDLINFN